MKLTKKIALVSASLALGMAAPAVLVAENASVTLAATQATAVTVTKKTAPYYHKDGSKFTKAKPYKYGKYSSATTGKGANYKVIKTVTIKGAKYYYIGNDAYLKGSDVKVTASKTVKAASSSKKTSTKTAAKKTTSTKSSSKKTSSKKTAAKKTSTKKAATAKKAAVPAGTATNVTSVTVIKKTTPFYHADGSKFTKANPYKYAGWTSTVAYKNITFKVSKELTLKGAKYYYIGNNAYLKASDVKVASSKKTAAKKTTSSKKTSTKKAAKTVAAVKVAKKTVPYYHKNGSKFTKAKPYKYNGSSSTVAYKNVSYNVVKTVTIKGAKYYYIGNDAYLKASDVTVTKTK